MKEEPRRDVGDEEELAVDVYLSFSLSFSRERRNSPGCVRACGFLFADIESLPGDVWLLLEVIKVL
jgi:hypothetical protein